MQIILGLARSRLKRIRGVSIFEAVIALFIAGFAVATFVPAFVAGNGAMKDAQFKQIATQSCRERIEELRQGGYQQLPGIATGSSTYDMAPETESRLPSGTVTVQVVRVNSSQQPSTSETGRRKVEVVVSWVRGIARSVRVATLIVDVAR